MKHVMRIAAALLLLSGGLSVIPVSAAEAEAEESAEPVTDEQAVEETAAEREAWAKSLFEGRCQMCHQLPEPDMLTPSQWKLILMVMQQRMQQANVPPLTEDETERLLEYLTARAR
jgi:hypothetical protein